ncbi:MAG: tetratricopeptide repeat protein [Saprospiraceae bacterium]|nr:tetratricopeptide repeat protein [Saprospiraceae bacterium]MCF8251532.1 tetratricopeptide repeat protein [Saprospiraceae bacterium]MCF8280862.1 tetratricopeptide repeat protein [Bacteroidales bacterium]MCF8310958.1 tetratricopeptide repeat protein [Saprospiraceae bacterium]MCF8439706.1 tetratricopeptide repeat protein [Saprospiraceae bacterium]
MKNLLAILFVLPFLANSQTEKGASPLNPQSAIRNPQSVRAVVIGISDYQSPDIPDLRFANKDAEAFANFLRSPAGGSLDGDHLKLLTNQNATAGRIAEALDGLIEQAKEGDQVIIYFSGHGDVEGKKLSQPGFLLCWDSPSRVYMGGGTYSLAYLQEIVSTLSVQNRAKVVVITDACHTGKLSGSQIGGAQLTSANLAKQYANEVKILSCQPNEFSLEGEQWGGGRGVFSYHLVDGLFGLADRNGDGTVTVGELDRYLEDHVTAEAAPQSQVPMLLGNRTERLAAVDAAILANLQKSKAGGLPVFAATEGRGLEDEVMAQLDSGIVRQYFAFKKAVAEKRFFPGPSTAGPAPTADELYAPLSAEPGLAPLHGFMKRNYAAALQDDAQQTLNEWLKTNQDVSLTAVASERLPIKVFTEKVRSYPRCLDRAAGLLGEKHYMYAALKARKYFFEGYLLANSNKNPDRELGEQALALFRQSLEWQPEQPQVYWQMSGVFGWNLLQPDSLEHYARLALEVHPNWTTPCTDAAFWLSYKYGQQDRARPFLELASRIDSCSVDVRNAWAVFNFGKKNFREAERQLKKAIALDSTLAALLNNLGYIYTHTRRYAEAEPVLKKAIALDSTNANAWNILGVIYLYTRRYAEGEPVLKKAVSLDSTYAHAWNTLGGMYLETRRYTEAEPVFKKAIALDSTIADFWIQFGSMYNQTRRYAEAETAYKKAIALDSTNIFAWNNLGNLYIDTRRFAEAEPVFKKAIALDSTNRTVWNNLGYMYLKTQRYAEAELAFKKAILLDSTNILAWHNLGYVYLQTRRYAKAEPVFNKAIALAPTLANPRKHLGMVYFKTSRPEEARQNFLKAIELNPNYAAAMLGMAYLLAAEGKTEEAIGYVEQAIGKGSTFEQLEADEDLAPLREQAAWKGLMKKYFPEKVKD